MGCVYVYGNSVNLIAASADNRTSSGVDMIKLTDRHEMRDNGDRVKIGIEEDGTARHVGSHP
jgi:hypothetical protein